MNFKKSIWKRINLKDYILSIETGKRPKGGATSEGIPSIGGEHINNFGGFNLEKDNLKFVPIEFFQKMKSGVIEKGDILVVKDGATTGKVAFVDDKFPLERACINEHIFLIRTKKELYSEYLYYYLRSSIGQKNIMNDFRGATVGGISRNFIDFEIYLPPLETQKKIVEVLEKAEGVIEKRREAINLLDELIKAKFVEMFGDPVKNPNSWLIKNYEDICSLITDGEHTTPKRCEKDIYLLSARNVLNHSLQLEDVDYIDEEEYKRISKRIIPEENDIIISCSGTVGRVCKVPKNLKFQMVRSIAILKLKDEINATFMEWLIDSNFTQKQILKSINQSTQANLFQ